MDSWIPKQNFEYFSRYENQEAGDFNAKLTKDYDKFDMILQVHFDSKLADEITLDIR